MADLSVLYMALSAANTGLCSVFDLLSTDPNQGDFNGTLLRCLLNSIKIPTQTSWRAKSGENLLEVVGQVSEHEAWMKRLKFTLLWNRDDLTSELLEECLESKVMKKPEVQNAFLNEGLVYALSCDKVKAVSAILQKRQGSEWVGLFNVGKRYCFVTEANEEVSKCSKKTTSLDAMIQSSKIQYMEASDEWRKLIEHATTPGPGFVTHFSLLRRKVRHDYKRKGNTWWGRAIFTWWRRGILHFKQHELEAKLGQVLQEHERCIQPGHPLPEEMRSLLYRRVSEVKKRDQKPQDEALEHTKNVKELMLLEGIYVDLLGDEFRYRMGIQGPHTDLFFWNILLNRCDLAELFWSKTVHPVRTAIAAAYLLRKVAKLHFLDHRTAEHLLENARHFEGIGVADCDALGCVCDG